MPERSCPHCRGDLPDPPGAVCPNCGRRLTPVLSPLVRDLLIAALALAVVVGFLVWRSNDNKAKAKRDVDSYIECLNRGGDNTTCTQLGP